MKRFDLQQDVVHDRQTGLMWPQNASFFELPLSWDEAFAAIEALNDKKYNAFEDWRVPNRRELFSLLSQTTINPSLPHDHPFDHVFAGYYWTSTSCARLPNQAWYIHLGGARVFKGMKYNAYLVWPVRTADNESSLVFQTGQYHCYDLKGKVQDCRGTGQDGEYQVGLTHGRPRFTEVPHAVLDHATGLIWMKDANFYKEMVNWETAFKLIERINLESLYGLSDWRVPTVLELESIVDMQAHSPALPQGHPFLNVEEFYWSSTTSVYDATYAWTLYLRDGAVGVGFKSLPEFYLWPVRGHMSKPR